MTLIYIAIIFMSIFAVGVIWARLRVKNAHRSGIYPVKGRAAIDDVKRLALNGETTLAICAYREIYGAGLKEAKEAVERMVSSEGS